MATLKTRNQLRKTQESSNIGIQFLIIVSIYLNTKDLVSINVYVADV